MRQRVLLGLNLALLLAMITVGLYRHGPAYFPYIMGAGAIYFLMSSWLQQRAPEQATIASVGCAWGWLAIVDGLLSQSLPGMLVGAAAMVVWVMSGLRTDAPKPAKSGRAKKTAKR